jgi:cysteine desulfurase
MMSEYFDTNATLPITQQHWDDLGRRLFGADMKSPGNASSPHAAGRRAKDLLESARRQLAASVGVEPHEVVFTASATESNNMVINSLAGPHAVSTTIEHPSIKAPLQQAMGEVHEVPPHSDPLMFAREVIRSIRPQTTLVTVIAASNETGQTLPVKMLGDWLHAQRFSDSRGPTSRERLPSSVAQEMQSLQAELNKSIDQDSLRRLHFHVDATQAFGKLRPSEWISPGVDSFAISGHKIGSLGGVGALLVRRGRPLRSLLVGGAQERARRAGTENLPGIVSLGMRAEAVAAPGHWLQVSALRERAIQLETKLKDLPGFIVLSNACQGLPNTVHAVVDPNRQLRAEDILIALDLAGVAASSGAACSSGVGRASSVVASTFATRSAEGRLPQSILSPDEVARQGIRFSLPVDTSEEQILRTCGILDQLTAHLAKDLPTH